MEDWHLMLVDGHASLHAGFYATADANLRNWRGEPTGALNAFVRHLLKIQREVPVTHFAVMMDEDLRYLHRRQEFPEYKKNRDGKCPTDLIDQFSKAREACEAFGVPWRAERGFEADDLIYTYATEASKDCDVHIMSVDKDLLQLVGPRVVLHNDLQDATAVMDRAKVRSRWGVLPEQMCDLLTLVGDASDGVPGVPGIGAKKAAALLQRYGSLPQVFEAARAGRVDVAGIGPALLASLVANEERARKMHEILKLRTVPGVDAVAFRTKFKVAKRDRGWLDTAAAFCEEQDMNSLANQLRREHADLVTECPNLFQRSSTWSSKSSSQGETEGTCMVATVAEAEQAMNVLRVHRERAVFAVSVEAADVDGHVWPLCFSIYGGPDIDFGDGPRLWVDLHSDGKPSHRQEVMHVFLEFFEDASFQKVYHNFGEERRRIFPCFDSVHRGLAGDTMQMARLWKPSLTGDYTVDSLIRACSLAPRLHRRSIDDAFGAELGYKNCSPQKVHSEEKQRQHWVDYSCHGAVAVFHLYKELKRRLEAQAWAIEGPTPVALSFEHDPSDVTEGHMWAFYERYWRPLGELLSEMEAVGFPVDHERLKEITAEAAAAKRQLDLEFRCWVRERLIADRGVAVAQEANVEHLNTNSPRQLSQLFFGARDAPPMVITAALHAEQVHAAGDGNEGDEGRRSPLALERLDGMKASELKLLCKEQQLGCTGKKAELIQRLLGHSPPTQKAPRPKVQLYGLGLEPMSHFRTKRTGIAQVTFDSLIALQHKQAEALGPDGVEAVGKLLRLKEVDSMLHSFLLPLEGLSRNSRVHPHLNINTETGRLSSRQPNLLGEPLNLNFPIREAFAVSHGRRLVIADYSQLELRVVAHLADCAPMLEILQEGGDIHSSTALRMFDNVREAVDGGLVALDERSAAAATGLPLVKARFPEERRRAKVLNFSLLYGKSAHGLAKEWDMTEKEAQSIIEKWFDAFPEIKAWKDSMERNEHPRTLLGRIRPIEVLANKYGKQDKASAKRKRVNSPVQGSAADIVISAMLRLASSRKLIDLGYHQLLQVHDEIILEGPEEAAEIALQEVVRIMEDPLPFRLRLPLRVEARHARAWQSAA